MKRSYLALLLLFLSIVSCQKSDNPNLISSAYFTVNGIHDLRMQLIPGNTSVEMLDLQVKNTASFQQTVSLSVAGLPSGVYIDTVNYSSYYGANSMTGIPDFSTQLSFVCTDSAKPGTYPVSLNCKGAATGIKTYTFNITLLPPRDCSAGVIGNYSTCTFSCLAASYSDVVTKDPAVSDQVIFHNFMNSGHEVYATLTCSSGSITIPYQYFSNGDSFSGYGSFYSNTISFTTVSAVIGGVSSSCSGYCYK